jgi:hypothetical protein
MEFTKVEVRPVWLYMLLNTGTPYETNLKFNRPTVNRDYIKILARCLSYADKNIIYPGVRNPLMHTVRDLCRHGYLERFIADNKRNKYYYKTTMKGVDLLMEAIKNSQW